MKSIAALNGELTKLGLRACVLETLDSKRFAQIHKPVGGICLYKLRKRVNLALEQAGRSERVSENKFRSCYRPEMLVKPLVAFCSGKTFQPRDRRVLGEAIKAVEKKLIKGKAKRIALKDAYDLLMLEKADHFAGLPTLGKKSDDVDALKRAEQCWSGKCPPPPVIGHRGKNTEVARAVWMFPFEWHIVEAAFYYPLYDLIYGNQTIYPVGPVCNRRYLARKYCAQGGYDTKFSIDYSGFDASLGTQMIGIAFSILSKGLQLNEQEQRVWERVQTFFSTSPFLAPDGTVYKGRRGGVPSGSMFTQLIDSVCNAVAIEYALRLEGIKNYRYMVYGDDSWTILQSREVPQKLLERIKTHVGSLGLKMNVDKTAYAKPFEAITFCGHYDIKRGRPLQECIDKLCYPERPSEVFRTSKGMCERLMAYMADADALDVLNRVFLSYYHSSTVEAIQNQFKVNFTSVMFQVAEGTNRRHLPGILQVIQETPKEASTLMKIRACI